MEVADVNEALSGMAEQHRRAMAGELAGPQGGPANRIVKGLTYSQHPDNYNPGDSLTKDELKKLMSTLLDQLADENGVVPVGALSAEVRGLTHPMKRETEAHESKFKMEEEGVITSGDIEAKASELQDELKEKHGNATRESLDEPGP